MTTTKYTQEPPLKLSREQSKLSGKGEGEEQTDGDWSTPKDPTWSVWKKTVGKQFEKPHRPCNWLGGKVPFPLNPSFKPPTPVSDALRNTLYQSFMADPKSNSVRNLAGRYHLSMKRVDAILRLKGLEENWVKGMERHLGVMYDASKHKTHEDWVESRIQTVEADALDQAEGDNKARTRYQRMFWEPVVEGTDPVLPNALKKAREDAIRHGRSEEPSKSVHATLGQSDHNRKGVEVTSTSGTAAGRPTTKFIDVGTKFLDPKDHLRRMKESERRARIRSKKVPKRRHLMAS
ncbi:eukaryotic mitochondrial regulator protein-domain-containing protein [Lactarius indigo]|nr:eukaryotic mitochondrial regulator protein-domain-containing protein [Lactarius indigo]